MTRAWYTTLSLTALVFPSLISAATLSGRVVEDRSGAALTSVDVRVYRVGERAVAAELETDGDGRFRADSLPSGAYRFEVSKAGHISSTVQASVSEAEPLRLSVRLIRCGVVSGRVMDANGRAVTGATVYAMTAGRGPLRPDRSTGRYAMVSGSGEYRLFNLPPGQYVVAVSYGVTDLGSGVQFYPSTARPQVFSVTGGESYNNVDFSVLPSSLYSVAGKVALPTPSPSGRFWLALAPIEQPSLAVAAAAAEQDGAFEFKGVPGGAYHLLASGPMTGRHMFGAILGNEPWFARTQVTVGSQDVRGVSLAPEKGRSVAFQLRASKAECASAGELALSSLEDWGAALERRVPVNAKEPQHGLAPARYKVIVTGLSVGCHTGNEVVVDLTKPHEGAPVIVTALSAGAIEGVVSGAANVTDRSVVLTDLVDGSQPSRVAKPDAQAKFTFISVRPGRYRLSAMPGVAGIDIEVGDGQRVQATVPAPVQP